MYWFHLFTEDQTGKQCGSIPFNNTLLKHQCESLLGDQKLSLSSTTHCFFFPLNYNSSTGIASFPILKEKFELQEYMCSISSVPYHLNTSSTFLALAFICPIVTPTHCTPFQNTWKLYWKTVAFSYLKWEEQQVHRQRASQNQTYKREKPLLLLFLMHTFPQFARESQEPMIFVSEVTDYCCLTPLCEHSLTAGSFSRKETEAIRLIVQNST